MRNGPVAAVVLAAGTGTRFGSTKQVALVRGRPLVRVTVDSIARSPLDEIVVVTGSGATEVEHALEGAAVRIVANPRYAEGMGSSVAAGIAALRPTTAGAVVALADQPLPAGVLDRLIAAWRRGAARVVAPSYRGTRGNPVLFDASLFGDLARLTGERGARDLIARMGGEVEVVEIDAPVPVDVDTADDLARIVDD